MFSIPAIRISLLALLIGPSLWIGQGASHAQAGVPDAKPAVSPDPSNLSNAAPDTQPVLRPPVQELHVRTQKKPSKEDKHAKPLDGMGTPGDPDWVTASRAERKDIDRARRKLRALAVKASDTVDSDSLQAIAAAIVDGDADRLLLLLLPYQGKDAELKKLVTELNETLSMAHADVKAETSDGNIRILMGASPYVVEFRLPSNSIAVRGMVHDGEKLVLQDGELKFVDAHIQAKFIGNHAAMQMTGDMGGPVTRDQ